MLVEELKKAVYDLIDKGIRLKGIEVQLNMPRNSLSGMLSGSRPFPKKWIRELEAYVKQHQAIEQNNLPANKERILADRERLDHGVMAGVPDYPVLPDEEIVERAGRDHKSPPPGLTKAQQIRWHRENSQTLQ